MELFKLIDYNERMNHMRAQNAKALNELSEQIRPLKEQVRIAKERGKSCKRAEKKLNELLNTYATTRRNGIQKIMEYKRTL